MRWQIQVYSICGIDILTQAMALFIYSLKYIPHCNELSIVFQWETNKY